MLESQLEELHIQDTDIVEGATFVSKDLYVTVTGFSVPSGSADFTDVTPAE